MANKKPTPKAKTQTKKTKSVMGNKSIKSANANVKKVTTSKKFVPTNTTKTFKTSKTTRSTKLKSKSKITTPDSKNNTAITPKSSTTTPSKNTAASASKIVVTKKTGRSTFERLRGLHLLSAGLFALLALAAGYFIKDTTFNVWLGHLTRDDLASRTTTVFAPAVHSIYDVNLRWITVGILAVSAILPLLWALRWKRQYQLNIEAEVMPQRWIELAVTSAIMVEAIALLSGVHDLMTLKLIGGLMATTCLLGWLADKQNRLARKAGAKAEWCGYLISLFTGSLPWILIAVTAVTTYIYGLVRSPWYVYALYATTLLGFGALAFNQRQHYRRANQWKFEVVELNYVVINLLVKAAFAAVLIAGLHR